MKKTNLFYGVLLCSAITLFAGCSNKKYEKLSEKIDSLSIKTETIGVYTQEIRDSINVLMPIAYSIKDTTNSTRKSVKGLYGKIAGVGNKVDELSEKMSGYKREQDSLIEANENLFDEKFASTDSAIVEFREQYGVDIDSLKKAVSKTHKQPKNYIGLPFFGWIWNR